MIKEAREAFKEFPEWFINNKWSKVHFTLESDWFDPTDANLMFYAKLFDNKYNIKIMLSFNRFFEQYKRCDGNKADTYFYVVHSIQQEFLSETYKIIMNEVGAKKIYE